MNRNALYLLLSICLIFNACDPGSEGEDDDDGMISSICNLESGIVPSPGYKYVLLAEDIVSHGNVEIQYYDDQRGYILEKALPFRLLRTADGGRSWVEVRRFEGAAGFKFRTSEEGSVFVNLLNENSTSAQDVYRNIIYTTKDSGLTWEVNEFLAAGRYIHPTYTFLGNTFLVWKEYQPNKQLLLIENNGVIIDEPLSFDTLVDLGVAFNGAFQAEEDAKIYPSIDKLIITNPGSNSKFYKYAIDDGRELGIPVDFGQKIEEVYFVGATISTIKGGDGNFYFNNSGEYINMNLGEEATLLGLVASSDGIFISKATDCGVEDAFRTSNYISAGRTKNFGTSISQDMMSFYNKSFADQFENVIILGQRSLHKLELE